jgi:hypothetical protein
MIEFPGFHWNSVCTGYFAGKYTNIKSPFVAHIVGSDFEG